MFSNSDSAVASLLPFYMTHTHNASIIEIDHVKSFVWCVKMPTQSIKWYIWNAVWVHNFLTIGSSNPKPNCHSKCMYGWVCVSTKKEEEYTEFSYPFSMFIFLLLTYRHRHHWFNGIEILYGYGDNADMIIEQWNGFLFLLAVRIECVYTRICGLSVGH